MDVQEVVKNLMITRIEVREETHPDVVRHVFPRDIQVIKVPLANEDLADARISLLHVLRDIISHLIGLKVSLASSAQKHSSTTAPPPPSLTFAAVHVPRIRARA